jgi:hypothetical protein
MCRDQGRHAAAADVPRLSLSRARLGVQVPAKAGDDKPKRKGAGDADELEPQVTWRCACGYVNLAHHTWCARCSDWRSQ